MKLNSDFKRNYIQEVGSEINPSLKAVTPNSVGKIEINGKTYEVNSQKESDSPRDFFQRIRAIAVGIFLSILTLGLLPAFSKSFREQLTSHLHVRKTKEYFVVEGTPRAGHPEVEITFSIAKCSHLSLKEENLTALFKIANQYTLNTEYAMKMYSTYYDGQLIHRPNHNGTHSARQVRCLDALFDLIEKKGLPEAKQQLQSITQDEKLSLILATYFLRAGRVDESSHKDILSDDYAMRLRSSMIYEAYAKQLGVNSDLIIWTKKLMMDACIPEIGKNGKKQWLQAHKDKKSKFAYDLLSASHELDLVRCYDSNQIQNNMNDTKMRLAGLVPNPFMSTAQLYDFAITLCRKTGSYINTTNEQANAKLYAKYSLNGDQCWKTVCKTKIPQWV